MPHHKPNNQELSPALHKENDEFSEFQGNFERVLGTATTAFK
jgi:hypothetical protein